MELTKHDVETLAYISEEDMKRNLSKILEWSSEGCIRAQVLFGICCIYGIGIQMNVFVGVEIIFKAANLNEPRAQTELGLFYLSGVGVEKNPTKAIKLFRLAADQGCAKAQAFLAECHYQGSYNVPRDFEKAFSYYKNIVLCHPYFLKYKVVLGNMYLKAHGTDKNIEEGVNMIIESNNLNDSRVVVEEHVKEFNLKQLRRIKEQYPQLKDILDEHIRSLEKPRNYLRVATWILNESDCCPICWDTINIDDVYVTKCLHCYHEDCKNQLLTQKCPLCREDLVELNI